MKTFDDSNISIEELRKQICTFAKSLGVARVVFSNKGKNVKGTYNVLSNILYIDTKQTKTEMLHTLFHELGHHTAVLKNKWKKYHYCTVPSMTVNQIFRIENKIDQIGKRLWNKYVNTKCWGKYNYSYPRAQKKNIIRDFISQL